jgi:hypothetical protein
MLGLLQNEDEDIRLHTHNERLKKERNSLEDISPNCETWIAALTDMQDESALIGLYIYVYLYLCIYMYIYRCMNMYIYVCTYLCIRIYL